MVDTGINYKNGSSKNPGREFDTSNSHELRVPAKIDGPNLVSLIINNEVVEDSIDKVPLEHRQYLIKHYLSFGSDVPLRLLQGFNDKVGVLREVLDWTCQDDIRIKELINLIDAAAKLGELNSVIEAMLKSPGYFKNSRSALSLLASNNEHRSIELIIDAADSQGKLRDVLRLGGAVMKTKHRQGVTTREPSELGYDAVLKASLIAGAAELSMYLIGKYREADLLVDLVCEDVLEIGVYNASRRADEANIKVLREIANIYLSLYQHPIVEKSVSVDGAGDVVNNGSVALRLVEAIERVSNGYYHEARKTRDGLAITPVIMGLEHAKLEVLKELARIAETDNAALRCFKTSVATWVQKRYQDLQGENQKKVADRVTSIIEEATNLDPISDQYLNSVIEYAWFILISQHTPEDHDATKKFNGRSQLEKIKWNSQEAKALTGEIAKFLAGNAKESQRSPAEKISASLSSLLAKTSDPSSQSFLNLLVDSLADESHQPPSAEGNRESESDDLQAKTTLEIKLASVLAIFDRIEQHSSGFQPIDCVSAAKKLAVIFDNVEDALCFINRGSNWLLDNEAGIARWGHIMHSRTGYHPANEHDFFDGIIRKQHVSALLDFTIPTGGFKRKQWAELIKDSPEVIFYVGQATEIERFADDNSIPFPDDLTQLRGLINSFSLNQLGLSKEEAGTLLAERFQRTSEAIGEDELQVAVLLNMAIKPALLLSIKNLTVSGFFMSTNTFKTMSALVYPKGVPVTKGENGYKKISPHDVNKNTEYWAPLCTNSLLQGDDAFELTKLCSLLSRGGALVGGLDWNGLTHCLNFNIDNLASDEQFRLKKALLFLAAPLLPTEALYGNNYRTTLKKDGTRHRKKSLDNPETEDELIKACRSATGAEDLPKLDGSSPIRFSDLGEAAEVIFTFEIGRVRFLELAQYVEEARQFMRKVREFSAGAADVNNIPIPDELQEAAKTFFSRLRVKLDPDADKWATIIEI